jgi:hypothetical protein
MKRQNFNKKYGDKLHELIDRLSWETSTTFEGTGSIPEDVPNPVIWKASFSDKVEESFINYAKAIGIEAKNIPSRDGQINGVVELSIPHKVLRQPTPALSEAQDFQAVQNKLARQEEENLINEAYDRKHNLGSYSY